MAQSSVGRLRKMAAAAAVILAVGMAYGIFVSLTGFGFPCIFRAVTGLMCPGCGVTHMCMSLMQLDFHAAFLSHPVIFVLLPVWLCMLIKNIVLYIRTGSYRLSGMENAALYFSVAALLLYGIVRNL